LARKQKGNSLPEVFLLELQVAHDHYLYLNDHVAQQDKKIKQWVKQNSLCQLLKSVLGIGDMTASQLVMEVGNGAEFKNGQHMAAWLGLVPRQYSTGGKTTLLGISKRGNKRLRCLFVHGARAVLSRLETYDGPFTDWLKKLRATKSFNVVCIALANNWVRIAWEVLSSNKEFSGKALQPGLQ
jgi:transposase